MNTQLKVYEQQKKILIIEDEADIRIQLETRLRHYGFVVELAGNGEAGLLLIEQSRPDLVILDLNLPTIQGEDVCKQIRESDVAHTSGIPIIMLTARGSDVDRIIGKVIGADAYMTKPFRPDELLAQIEQCLYR